jgi:hypothetical protein
MLSAHARTVAAAYAKEAVFRDWIFFPGREITTASARLLKIRKATPGDAEPLPCHASSS